MKNFANPGLANLALRNRTQNYRHQAGDSYREQNALLSVQCNIALYLDPVPVPQFSGNRKLGHDTISIPTRSAVDAEATLLSERTRTPKTQADPCLPRVG